MYTYIFIYRVGRIAVKSAYSQAQVLTSELELYLGAARGNSTVRERERDRDG